MTILCVLLTVAAVPLIHGAAVSDLVSLFHQYEDEILGRGQGVNPDPVEITEEAAAGEKEDYEGVICYLVLVCYQGGRWKFMAGLTL